MADRTQRLAIVVTAQDLAAGKLKGVRTELAGMSTSGKLASLGLGGVMVAGNRLGGALGTLKGRITGLTGAIGPLLGVGGLLGLGSLLTSSIREAAEFGVNVQKVAAVTNLATPVASAMVDTLDKWGLSSDRLLLTLGKMEKNVGALAGTTAKGAGSTEEIKKATEGLRVAQIKLHEVERKRGTSQSSLLAAQYRVADAERKLTELRKTGGVALSGAAAFQKQYGVSLLDNNGKIADANTLLLRSADYFNSNAAATDKATFMSKLWGKAWQDLVPILSKGSKFIRDQEADAIHLTKTQTDNIAKYVNAQRDFADTFGDVQVKVGAELMPNITSGLKEASAWFDTHGDEVAGFFRDAATFAGQAASAAGTIFSAVKGGWDTLPGPVKELLVGGFVANKASKFLFNIGIGDVLKGGGGLFAKGSSPTNPLFVSDVTGGLGKGVPGAAGGGGLLGMFGGAGSVFSRLLRIGGGAALGFGGSQLLGMGVQNQNPLLGAGGGLGMIAGGAAIAGPIGAIGGSVLAVAQTQQQVSQQSTDQANKIDDTMKAWLAQSPSKEALTSGLAGVEKGINDLQANPLNILAQGDALKRLNEMRAAIKQQLAEQRGDRLTGNLGRSGPMGIAATALDKTASTMTLLQQQLHADFRDAIGALRKATDPAAIVEAAKRVTTDILGGVGSGKTTKATIADLTAKRDLLLAAGDKTNAAILTAEIRKISPLVAGRAHQAALLAQGAKIAASNESVKQKVADLKGIENTLLSEHRTTAAGIIQGLIDVVNAVKGISIPTYPVAGGLVGNVHNMPGGPTPAPAGLVGNVHNMPTRQHGGPVWRDHDYLVGEKGPERFRPKRDGVIIPNASDPENWRWPGPMSGISKAMWLFTHGRIPLVGNFGRGPMPHRASGGPVLAGHDYLVGEKGSERYQDSGERRPEGLPWMAPHGSFWPSKSAYIDASQRHSYPAVDRSISNLTAGIVAAIRQVSSPHITLAVTASDMQKARVTRSRIVKPHGSRGSLVSEFG